MNNESSAQLETAEKALTILRGTKLGSKTDMMAPEKGQESELAETISCYCIKCGMRVGSFRNSWLQISRSYYTPLSAEVNDHDGIRPSGKAKVTAKGTELEGWYVDIWYRDFFKRSKISIMSDKSNLPVEVQLHEAFGDAVSAPKTDGSPDNAQKPPYSYVQLIGRALLSSPDRPLAVSEIIKWLRDTYPYYRNSSVNVSSNVSAQLSMCKDFIKQDKTSENHGRVNRWFIDPAAMHKYSLNNASQPQKKSKSTRSFATDPDTTTTMPLSDDTSSLNHKSHQANSTELEALSQATASDKANPSEVQRLKEVCILLEATTRSQKQDIESVSETVRQIEKTMKDLSSSMEQMRHEIRVRTHSVTPARQPNYNQEIELLTAKLTRVGRKAQEVDGLKLQIGLMNAKLKKMEEVSGAFDSVWSTATLGDKPASLGGPQEGSGCSSGTDTEVAHEDFDVSNAGDELGVYEDDGYTETVNANRKRSWQASRDLDDDDAALGESLNARPAASLLVFDDPEDVDYRPGQQQGTSTLHRARGGIRGRLSRGNLRQSVPSRLPTPEWEKPGFTYRPAPDGFYSPIATPNSRRGRMVARRGTGGASYSEPKRTKLLEELTTQLPLRNEEGIRLKPNGEPDMRGQWRRLKKEQKEMLTEQGKASRFQQQQDQSIPQSSKGHDTAPNAVRVRAVDTVEDGNDLLDIYNPNHAAVMKKIFPGGLPKHERRKSLAEQLFGHDDEDGDEIKAMTRNTEVAGTDDESFEDDV
ncbi:MAG: hypothetical protein M1836_001334 [Candelina mexicana]|nr:MAG: hypothetical protein M1836_001334 [Candelina mexicana]